jgi:hypothetical protein
MLGFFGRWRPRRTAPTGQRGRRPGVGLALLAFLGRAGPVDLDHADACREKFGGDPDAVAGGALDTDRAQGAVFDQPRHRPPVPGHRGGELPVRDRLPDRGDDRDVDGVLM